MGRSILNDTRKGIKWGTIEKITSQLLNFLFGVLLARLLTPEDYGLVEMITIFIAISQSVTECGFANALIRKLDRDEIDFSTAFYFNIVVGVFMYVVLFVSAPYIAEFFQSPILKDIIRVSAIPVFLNSLTIVQYAKLTINLNFRAQARVTILSVIISGVVGVCLAYHGFGVWALVIMSVVKSFLNTLIVWIIVKWHPLYIFSYNSFKQLFSYGSKLLVSGLLHTLYSNITTLLIGKQYSSSDLGYYSRGWQFASMPGGVITGVLQKVSFPILASIQNDKEHLIHIYRKYICVTSLIVFFMMSLMAALAKPLIVVLLTDKWIESVIYLQILCFAIMFDHICSLNLNLLQVIGRSDLYLKLEVIKKSIAMVILLIFLPFGVKAICISKVIYTQIAIIINTYYTGKLFGIGYFIQIRDFGKYFLLSIISVIPAYCLSHTNLNIIAVMILGALVSTILYVVFLKRDQNFNFLKTILIDTLKHKK